MHDMSTKLYKFRPLASEDDLQRGIQILCEKKFWHSKFRDFNDPSEGIFSIKDAVNLKKIIEKLYSEKESYVLCSFSAREGFLNAALWGYYANGFKGYVVEVEVGDTSVLAEVRYMKKIKYGGRKSRETYDVLKILTRKFQAWKHESEYRSIIKEKEAGLHEVGKITAVYFGSPYHNVENREIIYEKSATLKEYGERRKRLLAVAKAIGYKCYEAYVDDSGKVAIGEM